MEDSCLQSGRLARILKISRHVRLSNLAKIFSKCFLSWESSSRSPFPGGRTLLLRYSLDSPFSRWSLFSGSLFMEACSWEPSLEVCCWELNQNILIVLF